MSKSPAATEPGAPGPAADRAGHEARDPVQLLLRAGELLAASLDHTETLARLLELCVPTFADLGAVHLAEGLGGYRRGCWTAPGSSRCDLDTALAALAAEPDAAGGPLGGLAAGDVLVLAASSATKPEAAHGGNVSAAALRAAGLTSALIAPLWAHGRRLGLLFLGRGAGRPAFDGAGRQLVADLAGRAALAVDRARLFRAAEESRRDAERARQRVAFLARASAALADSLDYRTTLQTVVQLAVPLVADFCGVGIVHADHVLERAAMAHVDPELGRLLDRHVMQLTPSSLDDPHPSAVAIRTGRPVLIDDIPDELLQRVAAGDRESLAVLRRFAPRAVLAVPLEARGRKLGVITLVNGPGRPGFGSDDVTLAEDLARRAAVALDNARLYHDARAAEEEHRRQLEFTEAIIRSIADGIMAYDRRGNLTYLNPVAEQLLGRTADELRDRRGHELCHVADASGRPLPFGECRLLDVLKWGRPIQLDDQWFRRADGTVFPVALSSAPLVRDGEILGAVTVFRDVSERYRTMEALRQSEERLRRALSAARMVTWERDFATGRTVRSDLAPELFGKPAEEVLDDHQDHLRLIHPEDRDWVAARVAEAERAGTGYELEYRVLWPDGMVRWLAGRGRVFRDAEGRPSGMAGTSHDITERKEVQLELERLLIRRKAETEELRRLHQRVQRSLEALLGLHQAGKLLTSIHDPDAAARRLLEIAVRAARLDAAALRMRHGPTGLRLWQRVGSEPVLRAASRRHAACSARQHAVSTAQTVSFEISAPGNPHARLSGWCVPLVVKDSVIGVLEACGQPRGPEEATLEILESIGSQASTAIENARLYLTVADSECELRRLVHRLMVTQEEERRRVAYELHDGAAQTATGLQQLLEAYAHRGPTEPIDADDLALAVTLARRVVREVRGALAGLRPKLVDDFGLARGLAAHLDTLKEDGFQVEYVDRVGPERLAPEVEIALFRVAQEALANVRKHAATDRARLLLDRLDGHVVLEVADDGRGFDPESARQGGGPGERLGVLSMHERVAQVGGTLEVVSQSGQGTRVRARVPAEPYPERARSRQHGDA